MDKRAEKTKNSIVAAFVKLRAKKDIERITVTELAALADINKSTFYHYYKDIYDLSEQIENSIIADCVNGVENFADEFVVLKLSNSLMSQNELLNTIFSGSRASFFITNLHKYITERIYLTHPEIKNDLNKRITLSVLIYGIFHTFFIYKDIDFNTMIEALENINKQLNALLLNDNIF